MNGDRTIDRVATGVVLVLPLLPSGPAYVGFEPQPWLQAGFLALLTVAALAAARGALNPAARNLPVPLLDSVGRFWGLFGAVVVGACAVGLAAENVVGSPVFPRHLVDSARLLWPVDRMTDPLYPLQLAVVMLEGLVAYVAVRALCLSAADPARRAAAILRGWCCGFGLVAAFAVFQYLTRFRLHPFWVEANPDLVRSHATLDDPNALGSYLVLGVVLLVGAVLATDGRRRIAAATLAVLGVAGLMASASRAAIGILLLGALVGAALSRPTSRTRAGLRLGARALLGVVVLVVAGSLLARLIPDLEPVAYRPDSVVEAVASVVDPRIPLSELLEHRGDWWAAAVDMARDAPVLGVGLGRFALLLPEYSSSAPVLDAHNLYLQVLAETGLVGLFAFGALLASIFVTLGRLRKTARRPAALLAGAALMGSAAYAATFLTGHPLLVPSGQILWAVLLAAVVVFASSRGVPAPGSAPADAERPGPGEASSPAPPRVRHAGPGFVVCGVVLLLYAAAAARLPTAAADGPWGYSHGLYTQEAGPDGRAFRWSGGRALLLLRVPAGATEVRPEIVVSPAGRGESGTLVVVSLERAGTVAGRDPRDFDVRRVRQDTAYTVAFRIDPAHRFGAYVLLRLEVDPTFTPSRVGASSDGRELGVRVLAPTFSVGAAR